MADTEKKWDFTGLRAIDRDIATGVYPSNTAP